MTGRRIDAKEAYRVGSVSEIVEENKLLERAVEIGTSILEAPLKSFQFVKRYFTGNAGNGFEDSFRVEHDQAFKEIILKNSRPKGDGEGMESRQALLQQAGIASGQKVLDIGFRDLQELQEIASLVGQTGHVLGIDIDTQRVRVASKTLSDLSISNISTKEGSVLAIPARDRSFDLVFCKGVLHEIRRPEKAIAEMVRVCEPDGVIFIIDIQRFSRIKFELYRAKARLQGHQSGDFHPGFARERLLRMLSQQRLEELDYRQLPDKWHLGFNEVGLFLLKARRIG